MYIVFVFVLVFDDIVCDDVGLVICVCGFINWFGSQVVYDGLDLDVCCGEIFGVVGGLGIGKLVLMCSILGLCVFDEGCIEVFGVDVCLGDLVDCLYIECNIGVLFQDGVLFFLLIVGENVQVLLKEYYCELFDCWYYELVLLKVKLVGLFVDVINKLFLQLFGGMCKCVGLVCVLVLDLLLLFLDEFIVGLDLIGVVVFDCLIKILQEVLGLIVFLIMYDLDMLYVICDWVVVLVDCRVVVNVLLYEIEQLDYLWIQEYFYGLWVCVVCVVVLLFFDCDVMVIIF